MHRRDAVAFALIVAATVGLYLGLVQRDSYWPIYVLASGALPVVALSVVATFRAVLDRRARREP